MQAPAFDARCMKKSPAQTRHSLLASATVAPRSTAASAGFNPAAPLTAAITQSAGRAAASTIALSPAPHSVRVPASASFNSASRLGSAIADKARVEFPGKLRQRLHIADSRSMPRPDNARAHRAANPWCCRRSSRSRRARSRCARRTPQPCCYAMELRSCSHQTIRPRPTPSTPPRKSPKIAARTMAATKPSRRSISPP